MSDDDSLDRASGTLPKGKIEIVLRKSDRFDELVEGSSAAQRTQRDIRSAGQDTKAAVPI